MAVQEDYSRFINVTTRIALHLIPDLLKTQPKIWHKIWKCVKTFKMCRPMGGMFKKARYRWLRTYEAYEILILAYQEARELKDEMNMLLSSTLSK